jgi:hypothetical protein
MHAAQNNAPYTLFSPIVYYHPMAKAAGLPGHAAFWHQHCMSYLRHASALFVLMIPGWKDSKGVTTEIQEAKLMGIPIAYFDAETFEQKELQ